MALHARSDVAAFTISPEHGGCGDLHSRPVVSGAPVKLWSLDCETCENALRKTNHPHWSPTISGIPETPDETAYREDQDTKGRLDQQNQTAEALAKLSSLGDLPSAIAQLAAMFSGEPKREVVKVLKCPACSVLAEANTKFCPNCGQKFVSDSAQNHLPDLADLSEAQLRALASEKGLKPHHRAGKAKLVELIQEA